MKFKDITLKVKNKFLNMYEATYETEKGNTKVYEVISRKTDINNDNFGEYSEICDAIGIIAFTPDKERILLSKEFRMACNGWVYNFPGGLIDQGESIRDAAARELMEETGLTLVDIDKVLYNAFTAVGITDERLNTVICTAMGCICGSDSEYEEIESDWYTKEEVLQMIENHVPMSLRTQSFLYMWAIS